MASRSTVNLNNYEQQDEEAGEEYAMLPNSSSRTPLNGTRSDGYSPLSGTAAASKKPWGNKRKALIFVGLSFVFGFIIHIAYTLATDFKSNRSDVSGPSKAILDNENLSSDPMSFVPGHSKNKSKQDLKDLVQSTNGYFIRDFSVWLGWNNIRYIIESSLLHAQILNRTAILPGYVYARACEFDQATCGAFAEQVNRGKATGDPEWNDLPESEQQGWKIPLGVMVDLDHLSETYKNFMTLDEYFDLEGLSADVMDYTKATNGQWQQHYNNGNKYHAIENDQWDPPNIVRVDIVGEKPEADPKAVPAGLTAADVEEIFGEEVLIDWPYLRVALQARGFKMPEDSTGALAALGYRLLYTYDQIQGMDFLKSPINPITQVAKESSLRGLYEDGYNVKSKLFHVKGEIHLYRRAGSLRFTTPEARDNFKEIILEYLKPLPRIYQVATIVDARMREMNQGRAWASAHMRRGDFESHGWAMEANFKDHLARIMNHLDSGIDVINKKPKYLHKIPGEDTLPGLPKKGDHFYIGTDERNTTNLEYLRSQGGVLLSDILTPTDRDEIGPMGLFTDVLALLDQVIMSEGAYFYGHALSSVAGGVVNFRTAAGYDEKCTLVAFFT
ncbi:hypothetical protein E3Q22_00934 [Wallemia mellicola]|uniref:O-fucosyltransferase family protein n=1 Tax=Wallemia mellicola TaxID=1708541 RepID=A0A4T0MEJ1_9BASI|nr:hypothetical protein E3Q22_00934 [Wallemia mellicola]TIC04140.1 hypothetical protein E3Q17_00630 [Wallemia mellicola]